MTTLLVDGDIVAYKAAAAAETPIDWGNGVWTLHATEQDVIGSIKEFMGHLIAGSDCDDVVSCLTGSKNYRKDIASYYKENRVPKRKPMLLGFAKDFIYDNYNGRLEEGIEADDLLGILGSGEGDNLIWSADKDLLTIPARHFIDGRVVTINEEEADYHFFLQTLVGDSTDNYKGCPTIGEKTAKKLLEKECSWEAVVKQFEKKGLSEEVAIENARLARILRHGEYDFETKEVTLWAA